MRVLRRADDRNLPPNRQTVANSPKIRVGDQLEIVRAISKDLDMEYTVVGETASGGAHGPDRAPGSILTRTIRLAEGYIAVSLGPVPIKGLAEPEEVYELVGAGPAHTRLQAATIRGLTQFVGREAELDQLRRAQQPVATGSSGQLVAIIGEAGVGKSRLLYEFTHSHRLLGWLVLETTAISLGRATSYLPVVALLKSYFAIQDRDEQHEIRRKVVEKTLALDEGLEPTLPAYWRCSIIPSMSASWHTLDPVQRRRHCLDAVRSLILQAARKQPVLLIFEDLHWVDDETQALRRPGEALWASALLLLVTYRPDTTTLSGAAGEATVRSAKRAADPMTP